jgi:hypothetical protein
MGRNTNPSIAIEGWHPHHFFASEPEQLLREYTDYRAVTLEHLAADPLCRTVYGTEQMRRVFDLVHLKYLAPLLAPAAMDYLIEQSMSPDATPKRIIDGLWKAPFDRRTGTARWGLVELGRVMLWPRQALRLLDHVLRMLRFGGALAYGKGIRASMGRDLGMSIARTDHQSGVRRYLLSRTFVSQMLSDRRRITASHVADIIDHFDDYV